MRPDMITGRGVPRLRASRPHRQSTGSSRSSRGRIRWWSCSAAGLLSQGSPAARGLLELHREMEVGYCRLVTISTDNIIETNEFRTGVGAHWPFLSDPGRKRPEGPRHRRVHRPGAQPDDPAHDRAGARPCRLQDLQRLLVLRPADASKNSGRTCGPSRRKCRPDWDITTPDLKAAWEQGRKDLLPVRQDVRPDARQRA